MDVGYIKTIFVTFDETITFAEAYEKGKLLGGSYNCIFDPIAASAYEWWPYSHIRYVQEGCYIAIVAGHQINPDNRHLFM